MFSDLGTPSVLHGMEALCCESSLLGRSFVRMPVRTVDDVMLYIHLLT